jgi:hypothetical protein
MQSLVHQCVSSKIAAPSLFGAAILSIKSSIVSNYTVVNQPASFFSSDPPLDAPVTNLTFCNVTVEYTHPGQDDNINVFLWLPLSISENAFNDAIGDGHEMSAMSPQWNGVLLFHGGGGYSTCLPDLVSQNALTQGYAISRTDGGHVVVSVTDPASAAIDPSTALPDSWALISPGSVNYYALDNFATRSLNELSIISKQIVRSFYGRDAKHSYFQGCSTGGRQGLMLAQRYPSAYDGILVGAPAIYWPRIMVQSFEAQILMQYLNVYPRACEFDYITSKAIEACDELDGVKDNLISNKDGCRFDASTLLGNSTISCTTQYADVQVPITEYIDLSDAAVYIANYLWPGGKYAAQQRNAYIHTHSAPLSPVASTKCFHANNICIADPDTGVLAWIRLFLYKDPALTTQDILHRVTFDELDRLITQSEEEYNFFLSSSSPDLNQFYNNGGKIIAWHGLSDQGVMPGGTIQYYQSVLDYAKRSNSGIATNVSDFFRLFLAPGIQHCTGGEGILPINVLSSLRAWVENGTAPDTFKGESVAQYRDDGLTLRRRIRPWPQVAKYVGGDWTQEESYECAESF